MSTERQINANRDNAKQSTGPKSAEGKSRSARNAMIHGMAARSLPIFPDEDTTLFQTSLDMWLDDLQPNDSAERALVESACLSHWRIGLCSTQENAVVAYATRHAGDDHERLEKNRASDLGRRLQYDRFQRFDMSKPDQATREIVALSAEFDPETIVRELESFVHGVNWMIARWAFLTETIATEGYWHTPEKFLAIKLLGKRPEDMLSDIAIGEIYVACHKMHPEPMELWDECMLGTIGRNDRPLYVRRVEHLRKTAPKTIADARSLLIEFCGTEVDRLVKLKEDRLTEMARLDKEEAASRQLIDTGPSAMLRLRYETAAARELHRSLSSLATLRKEAPPAPKPLPPVESFEDIIGGKETSYVNVQAAVSRPMSPVPAAPNEPNFPPLNRADRRALRRRKDVRKGPNRR